MECDELTGLAIDRLTGEISPESSRELEDHLSACGACSREADRVARAWALLGEDPDATMTAEFRRRSRALLEEEMIRARVREFRPHPRWPRVAAQAAALLVAGGLGYVVASRAALPRTAAPAAAAQAASSGVPDLRTNPRLSNVSYQSIGPGGRIGIGFDVTTRRTVEGLPTDPAVSSVLAYLVSHNAETAGEKSRAIELVSERYAGASAPPSPDIVAALTKTLRRDPNPGVRKKAAEALAGMKMTPEIRSALLDALKDDRNPAVRLVAIDRLAAAAKESPDRRTIQSLRERAFDPGENGFVRAKAASALKTIEF